MSEIKFKNKYRIPSNRLKNWDYSENAAYFITICTQNREHFFGQIKNGTMYLNELGENALRFWLDIPNHFPFIELGNFVVMPNHTHGILIINKMVHRDDVDDNGYGRDGHNIDTPNLGVSIPTAPPIIRPSAPPNLVVDMPNLLVDMPNLGISTNPQKPKNGGKIEQWKPGTIGVIINQYKRIVTINNRKINPDFKWQSNYHDHIIRNSLAFENIQNYIEKNPLKWKEDKFR